MVYQELGNYNEECGVLMEGVCMEKVAILAAYNLENSIGEIVERTKKFVDTVIVVSDRSNDNTNMKVRESVKGEEMIR